MLKLQIVLIGLFWIMVSLMVGRTAVFGWRTMQTVTSPPPPFHPEINECSHYLKQTQGQLRGLYNYRSLGQPCQ